MRGPESDDLVQSTWLAALVAPPRSSEAALAWLSGTVRNLASKSRRAERRRVEREERAARPESVAATDDIVSRLELQRCVAESVLSLREPYRTTLVLRFYDGLELRAIAEREGVPLETVRTRLRRALEELRGELARRPWRERRRWAPALLGAVGLSLATAASACTRTMGVGVMASKLWIGAAIAAVAAGMWLVSRETLRPDSMLSGGASSAAVLPPEGARAEPGSSPVLPPQLEPTSRSAATAEAAAPPRSRLSVSVSGSGAVPGIVRLRALDSRSGEPLALWRARFLSDSRYAEVTEPTAEISLSPGSYEGLVCADGYESAPLASFDVESGETLDLGDVRLSSGSARILGLVRGVAGTLRDWTVQLAGAGRHPCPVCPRSAGEDLATPADDSESGTLACPACGYATDRSAVKLASDGSFLFENLSAGFYVVKLVTPEGRGFDAGVTVVVRQGQDESVELDFPSERTLEVALVDARDGRSLAEHWSELGEGVLEKVEFQIHCDGRRVAGAAFAASSAVPSGFSLWGIWRGRRSRGSLGHPWPGDLWSSRDVRVEFSDVQRTIRSAADPRLPPPIDRAREATDSLNAAASAPELAPIAVAVTPHRDGSFLLEHLPASTFMLVVRAGDRSGGTQVLAGMEPGRITLPLSFADESVREDPDIPGTIGPLPWDVSFDGWGGGELWWSSDDER